MVIKLYPEGLVTARQDDTPELYAQYYLIC